ncbi:hypothetical protein LAZ67_8001999 [Cordylochernes scorpioides]|uniref:Uncharacterized protein n=1 Tax=Cordylochernes scorpioides TaxID=51811 RepID=A0ABY6KQP1_9ARAC|nr:hypothetical protein LAZ67_8001999 [Cordylochernes scorpioides]
MDTYEGLMGQEKLKEFKLGMKKQQFMFTKLSQESEAAVHASYALSEMIAKHSKPFTEGDFIKECLIKAAEIVCPGSVKTFQAISLSRNTVVERVTDMARNLNDQIKENSSCFEAFSIACDENVSGMLNHSDGDGSTRLPDISGIALVARDGIDSTTRTERTRMKGRSDRREQQWDDTNFEAGALSEPHLLTKGDSNDLVRDLDLSKKQSELLGSRLKGWNLLHKGTKVCFFRKRQDEFQDFFSQENYLVYCNDVVSLMEALGHDHDTEEWRLFPDSSKISLKAVLLHNGNKFPSLPIAHASNMKESYENMKLLLKKIEYERYGWKICSDLKVIAFLRGLQLGYTKLCCFLCEWDSRDRERHYIKKSWPNREIFTPGHKNILNPPLIDSENIYLPRLHIKLGLMKKFVKAMDRNASGFVYLKQKCSNISDAKFKEGIFVGPQIRELPQNGNFQNSLKQQHGIPL